MEPGLRLAIRIAAVISLLSAAALWWYSRNTAREMQAVARGEEVYASHDCTDCHLAAHTLRQKKERNEPGLIRSGRSVYDLRLFLEKDAKHQSYLMMSQSDRDDLVQYLRSLLRR
jgi:mono/diheme cytochrome c family protein